MRYRKILIFTIESDALNELQCQNTERKKTDHGHKPNETQSHDIAIT